MNTFERLIEEHGQWADATFPKCTSNGALLHAHREIDEIIQDIADAAGKDQMAIEYADALLCIMDSARREGFTVEDIVTAGFYKLGKNKARKWKDNGDGSYSHIKE